jgi:hypothetical protein
MIQCLIPQDCSTQLTVFFSSANISGSQPGMKRSPVCLPSFAVYWTTWQQLLSAVLCNSCTVGESEALTDTVTFTRRSWGSLSQLQLSWLILLRYHHHHHHHCHYRYYRTILSSLQSAVRVHHANMLFLTSSTNSVICVSGSSLMISRSSYYPKSVHFWCNLLSSFLCHKITLVCLVSYKLIFSCLSKSWRSK